MRRAIRGPGRGVVARLGLGAATPKCSTQWNSRCGKVGTHPGSDWSSRDCGDSCFQGGADWIPPMRESSASARTRHP